MTISSTTVQTSGSTGNSVTTQFSFSFHIDDYGGTEAEDQIQVILETIATGVETVLTRTTHYTVSINGDQSASPGGSITTLTAYSSAYKIWIRLAPVFTQATDYQNQGGFLMETVEDQADQQARQINVLADRVRRAPRAGVQAGTSFDGEITGDLTAGAWPALKSDLSGFQWVTNSGDATAVTATGTTTARTLADRADQDVRSILDAIPAAYHTAILDGTSTQDLTTYINDALGNDKDWFFPRGRYPTADGFVITQASAALYARRATLYLLNSGHAHVLSSTDISDVWLEGFIIDGNKANQSVGSGNAWRGIYALGECHRWRIRNVEVKDCVDHGLMGSDGGTPADETFKDSVIENCYAHDCGSAAHISGGGAGGSGFNGGSKTTKWRNNFSRSNYLAGFKCNGTHEFCDAASNGTGFTVGTGTPANSLISYIGCRALGGTGDGFRFESADDPIRMIGCEASGHTQSGVTILNTINRLQIIGLMAYNNGNGGSRTTTNGLDAISILQTSGAGPKKIIIEASHLYDNQGSPTQDYGVYVDDPSTDVLIAPSNIIEGNELGPVLLGATAKGDNIRIGAFTGSTANYRNKTPVSVTATTDETDLMSTSLEADEQFSGKIIRGYACGTIAGANDTKVVRLKVGASGSIIISSQTSGETQDWACNFTIVRVGNTCVVSVQAFEEGGTSALNVQTQTEALSSDLTVKFTGDLNNTGDTITQTFMSLTADF